MRFLGSFKKTCTFERWQQLVSDLKPYTDKHGLRVVFATESEDGSMIYDVSEAKTMEGAQAFLSDPEVMRMRKEAGVDIDSQEMIASVDKFHIFQ